MLVKNDVRREVGIVCGTHGDEEKSRAFYEHLQRRYLPSEIEVILGNPLAFSEGRRCTAGGKNLNQVFPGNPDSPIYEERLAAELMGWAATKDVVLDVHESTDNASSILVHPDVRYALRGLCQALMYPTRTTIAGESMFSGQAPNVVTIELGSQITPFEIETCARRLVEGYTWYPDKNDQWYQFVRDVLSSEVPPHLHAPLTPFEPLPTELVGVIGDAQAGDVPQCWLIGSPYLFELLRPIPQPSTVRC